MTLKPVGEGDPRAGVAGRVVAASEAGAERGLDAEQREEVGRDGADGDLLGIAVGVEVAAVVADGGDVGERLRLRAHVEEGRLRRGELVDAHQVIGRAVGERCEDDAVDHEKMEVAAPTPSASVSTARIANPGARARREAHAVLKSEKNDLVNTDAKVRASSGHGDHRGQAF